MSKQDVRKDLIGQRVERVFHVNKGSVNMDSRTVELAFSSEVPYERWYGYEILDHSGSSVRMDRLQNGAAFLVNHDMSDHVGVVENASIDGDGKGRAIVRLGNSARAEEVLQDINDGIKTKISVGYMIHSMILEKTENEIDTYRVNDWEPYEISSVSIPADDSVGLGRALIKPSNNGANKMPIEEKKDAPVEKREVEVEAVPEIDAVVKADRSNIDSQIKALASAYKKSVPDADQMAEDIIGLDGSIDDMKTKLRDSFMTRASKAVPATTADPKERVQWATPRRASKLTAFENSRDGEEAAYRSGMWALAVTHGNADAMRWCNDYGVRVMTGNTSTTASIVPEEMILPIIDLREHYGVARQEAYVHQMMSDTATVPRRKSGVTAYFPGRSEATTESDASFDDINLVAREVSALTRIANSYEADSAINLGDHLASEMAYAFAVKEDDCLFNGDGTSTYGGIYGIRAKIVDGNHTVGAIDATTGTNLLSEIDSDDLLSLSGALPEFPGINPKWFASKRANALVFDAIKAAAGGNTNVDLGSRQVPMWLGDEIVISQSMPKVTTDLENVAMLIYGDMQMGVTFGDRQGFEIQVLSERYAEYRQVGIIATERMDINVHGLGDTSDAGSLVALIGA